MVVCLHYSCPVILHVVYYTFATALLLHPAQYFLILFMKILHVKCRDTLVAVTANTVHECTLSIYSYYTIQTTSDKQLATNNRQELYK